MAELALFDLDNTLLDGDSDYEWAQFLIEQGVLERAVYEAKNQWFYDQYKAGTLDIFEFLDFQLAPLARYPRAQLDRWHAEFMATRVLPMVKQAARPTVERHRASGATLALVTATNAFVTAPIARLFGIDHLIATDIEEVDGRFTGRPHGVPSFREGKVTRLEAWLAERGTALDRFERSWFYSDSANDVPLLERVTDPVVVDGDDRLVALGRERGWQIVSLR
jgi:HAD superfamily hydrolase (TIGR01490 family)